MSRLRLAPVVEGHGEERSVRILLERIWHELLGGEYVEVMKPVRQPRDKLVNDREVLLSAIDLADINLKYRSVSGTASPAVILVLLDAHGDLPCELGPRLQAVVADERPHLDVACVVANLEYETWFVAAAESLTGFLELEPGEVPDEPEVSRSQKAWVEARFRGTKYSERLDQPRMTAAMDIALCRRRSPSFDKLCRELEMRLRP